MSLEGVSNTKAHGKKRIDISVMFAICGALFSVLIFLFMLKQERQAAIQQFHVEATQNVASFQQQVSRSIYQFESSVISVADNAPKTQSTFDQLVKSSTAIMGISLLKQEAIPSFTQESKTGIFETAIVTNHLNRLEEQTGAGLKLIEIDGEAYIIGNNRLADPLPAAVLLDLSILAQKSSLASDTSGFEVQVSDTQSTHRLAHVSEELAKDSMIVTPLQLPFGTGWTVKVIASEAFIKARMSYIPALFLLTGLLLSFLLASYLKRMTKHLEQMRQEQEVMSEQMLDTTWNDPLTGLSNRIHFDEALEVECRRAVREFSPLTLILLRIDNYKMYGEHYGIDAADILLQQISESLKEAVGRPGDMIARLDNHLFGFILPSTNELVVQLAERCCETIREKQIPNEMADSSFVSLSVGVATLQPSRLLTAERLFDEADKQLTEAIQAGGDQYKAFAESSFEPSATYSV